MPTIHSKSDPSSGSGVFIKYPRISGYTVLDHLHEGSHSSIYMARQDRLGRVVAMKLVPEWPPPTDVALERFNRAAYVCAHTPHPGLTTLYDVGTRDGYYYATYTHMEGQTLQRHLGIAGHVDETFAVKVGLYVCRTLMALHGNNICHRNVKPKNLFLENNGNIRMIGLGLASCKSAFFSPHLDAHAIGTPHFMAPEMIKGSCADPRSDLYSLGVTLYVMVAGRPPYDRGIPAVVMSRHLTDTPASLKELRPELSSKFVGLIEGLMVKDPAKRIPSAAEAAAMFEALGKKHSSFWSIAPLLGAKPAPPAPAPPTPAPAAGPAAPAAAIAPVQQPVAKVQDSPKPAAPAAIAAAIREVKAPVPRRSVAADIKSALQDPIVAALLAAIGAVLFLLIAMYVATLVFGASTAKREHHAAPPEAVPEPAFVKQQTPVEIQLVPEENPVAENRPQADDKPQVDPEQKAEFERLLVQQNNFQNDPDAGIAAWSEFIQKNPNMPAAMKTVADERLELYQLFKTRNAIEIKPRSNEPEF